MFLRKIRISITKIILPFLHKILQLLKANTRTVNFLNDKKINANNAYNFQTNIEVLLKNKKLIGLDVGAQGGFNSDKFFPEKYNKYFESILVDPLKNSLNDKKSSHAINKGLWSSKEIRKLYILNKRPESSSMYEPDRNSLTIYGFEKKDFHLFDVDKIEMVECDTLSSSLKELNINSLDYLKIDTQGSELEILKGLESYRPLIIKCEVQIFPMYKNTPSWTEVTDLLYKLGYIVSDWKKIGSHATRTPVEMDMVFIPNFLIDSGKKLILEKEKEFISLMLISGQIKLLKKVSKILNLGHSDLYMKTKDRYFN
ncbi:FkbM family methyltransferase [Pelagibacterales bacterium SAG-MED05]|nr:FkbM family methyltransferase [Pelagibacterales bacterium SAG-MED05]